MYRAKITRNVHQEQESTNRTDYEEIELNLQSERAVISIATKDNVAYEHISPKNVTGVAHWVNMNPLGIKVVKLVIDQMSTCSSGLCTIGPIVFHNNMHIYG